MDTGIASNGKDSNFANLVKGKTDETATPGAIHGAGDWDRRVQHLKSTFLLLELGNCSPLLQSLSLNIPSRATGCDIVNEALFQH